MATSNSGAGAQQIPTTIPASMTIYGYYPNEPLAYAAVGVFAALCLTMIALNIRFKSWFMMVIPAASMMELIGFALRPFAALDVPKYVVSTLMILLAPTVFAMADYSLLSKMISKTKIEHPIFTAKRVKWVFLAGDICSFLVQVSGGGLTAITSNIPIAQTGAKILLAGLAISLCVFSFFLFMTAYIHYKMRNEMKGKWKFILYVLYFNMILLLIRSAYRIAEYGNMQYHNSVSVNEPLFYCLDVLEMFLLNLSWIPFHPGFWDMTDSEETKESKDVIEL